MVAAALLVVDDNTRIEVCEGGKAQFADHVEIAGGFIFEKCHFAGDGDVD